LSSVLVGERLKVLTASKHFALKNLILDCKALIFRSVYTKIFYWLATKIFCEDWGFAIKFFHKMQKENIKSRNFNIASYVLILFVFFFTLFSFGKNVYATGEIWSVTNTPSTYMGGINEAVPQALVTGTIYSFDYYGGWEWSSGHGGDTLKYVLWEKNSGGSWIDEKDCQSVEQSASAWGLPFYPSVL